MAPTISPEEQYKYRRGINGIRKDSNCIFPSIQYSHIGKTQAVRRLDRKQNQRKYSVSTNSSDDEDNITSTNSSIDNNNDSDFESSLTFCNGERCNGSCSENENDVNCNTSHLRKSQKKKFDDKIDFDEISSASLISTLDGKQFQKSKLYKRQPKSTKGLFDIAIKTIQLIKRNELLHQRLAQLQFETKEFIESVMSNPENSGLKLKIENNEMK